VCTAYNRGAVPLSLAHRRPQPTEHAPYYGTYVALVPENDILAVLRAQRDESLAHLHAIPESQADVLHPPYTWTIKQVVNHITDGERIFAYRALRFARGDATELPGFDENEYARTAGCERLKLAKLVDEFDAVRRSTLALLENLPEQAWTRCGEANGNAVTVRALAFIIAGHVRHHLAIVRKRLGPGYVRAAAERSGHAS
jgi:hypothetical protein